MQIKTRYHYTPVKMSKKKKKLAIKMMATMWNNKKFYLLLMEMQNIAATLEDILAFSYKDKHTLTIQSSNHAPNYLPKWV